MTAHDQQCIAAEGARISATRVMPERAHAPNAPAAVYEQHRHVVRDVPPLLAWTSGLDGGVTWMNAAWLAFTGRSLDDALGDGWIASLHPDDVAECAAAYRSAIAAREPFELEYRLRRHDGVYRWMRSHGVPHPDERGAFAGFVGSCVDISDRTVLLNAVERASERLEVMQGVTAALGEARTAVAVGEVLMTRGLRALHAARGVLMRLDAEGTALTLLASTGYPDTIPPELAHVRLSAPFPIAEAARSGAAIMLSSSADVAACYPGIVPMRPHDAEALVAVPLRHQGRVIAVLGATWREARVFDGETQAFLTALADQGALALERARLFDAAAAARVRAEFLADVTQTLATSMDYDTTLAQVARAALPMLADWCVLDILADPTSDAWPPTFERVIVLHADATRTAWADAARARFATTWHERPGLLDVLRHGETLLVPQISKEMLAAWLTDPEDLDAVTSLGLRSCLSVPLRARGRTLGALSLCMAESGRHYSDDDRRLAAELAHRAATAVDNARLLRVAERERAAADAANHAKAEFLTIMSHELRTPLNAIGGYTELLQLGVHGPISEAQQATLARIQHSQHHLLGMINEVLNFARLDAATVNFAITDVAMPPVLHAVAPLVQLQAEAKGQQLALDARLDDVVVRADVDKLQQILVNLLSNAIKFTPAGGTITIACTRRPRREADDAATPQWVDIAVRDTGPGIAREDESRIFEPFVQVGRSRYGVGEGTGLGLAISRDLARGMGGELRVRSVPGHGSAFTLTLASAA